MTDTPETIWASPCDDKDPQFEYGQWTERRVAKSTQEYRRADIPATDAQILANPKVQALVECVKRLNAACDAMWNDHGRVELLGKYDISHAIKESHVKAISEAQQKLHAALAALETEK